MSNAKNDGSQDNQGIPGGNEGITKDADKGDNRGNSDRDGNRSGATQAGTPQPGSVPDGDTTGNHGGSEKGRNPGVGHDDQNKSERDRGDGRRSDDEGGVN